MIPPMIPQYIQKNTINLKGENYGYHLFREKNEYHLPNINWHIICYHS